MTDKPYISVVIVGRNDDYGQNFLGRINTFIRSLDHQVKSYPDVFELVVVEWNPMADKEPLASVLIPTQYLPVRVITVPEHLHQTIGAKSPVLEFHGKNVGIRRARGEFVLVTNPDILFSTQLIDELSQKKLRLDTVYRTDRYDFYGTGIDDADSEDLVDFAVNNTFQVHGMVGEVGVADSVAVSERDINLLPRSNGNIKVMHTNACGDFMLAAKEVFYTVRGMYETLEQRWHVDSISLLRFQSAQVKQHIFLAPCCIFHQHHDRAPPDVDYSYAKVVQQSQEPGRTDWGLMGQELEETIKEPR